MGFDGIAFLLWVADQISSCIFQQLFGYFLKCCWQNRHQAKTKVKEAWIFANAKAPVLKKQVAKVWDTSWQAHERANQELFELITGDPESLGKAWQRHKDCIQACADLLKGEPTPFSWKTA